MNDHLTARENEILEILKKEPMLAQDDLAGQLGISRSATAVHISNLMRKGYITGRGYIFDERNSILVVGKTWLEIDVETGGDLTDGSKSGHIKLSGAGNGYLLSLELARRHLEPNLLTYLGRDEVGEQIFNHLLSEGVNVQNVIRGHNAPTGRRLVLSSPKDVALMVKDDEAELPLDMDAISSKEFLIKNTKILLIDGSLPFKTLAYLASLAINNNIMVSVLGCPLSILRAHGLLAYPQFFVVCPARHLVDQVSRIQPVEPEELFPACKKIVSEGSYALVAICGDQGLILATAEETVYLPTSPLHAPGSVLNITAGIAEGLAAGYMIRMAVRRAMGGRTPG
jgi:pseudouridine kinase